MKKITLPIGTRMIFESLADIAVKHGEDREEVIYEMARESISSFTPSGEIGDNPTKGSKSVTISYAPDKEKLYNVEKHKFAKSKKHYPFDFFVVWAIVNYEGGELVVEKFVSPSKDGHHFAIDDGNGNIAWGDSTDSVVRKWFKKFG